MVEYKKFRQGAILRTEDPDFGEGLRAAVDYRGDVTIKMQDGTEIIGYVFNGDQGSIDLFPLHGSQKETVDLKKIRVIEFSGEDTAQGKSWEEWIQKRAKEADGHEPSVSQPQL